MKTLLGIRKGRHLRAFCVALLAILLALLSLFIIFYSETMSLIQQYLNLLERTISLLTPNVLVSVGYAVHSLLAILGVLIVVAFFTLFERKLLSSIQRRRGPNVAGFWGSLQPIADGLKLLIKEFIKPRKASSMFFVAPVLVFFVSLNVWAFTPVTSLDSFINVETSLYYIMGFSSLSVYGVMGAGWASGSRYALLGGLRAVAQLISYEIALGMLFVPVILMTGSASVARIVEFQLDSGIWNCVPWCGLFMMFLVIMLAETNRTPFDLPEAEAELVAGFNVEYSSGSFALFFLAEYASMYLMSVLAALIFMGGYGHSDSLTVLFVKSAIFATFIVLIRGVLPRYRYDQLMSVHWRQFLLFVFAAAAFGAAMVTFNESTPLPGDLVEVYALQQLAEYGYGFAGLAQSIAFHPLGNLFTFFFDFYDNQKLRINFSEQLKIFEAAVLSASKLNISLINPSESRYESQVWVYNNPFPTPVGFQKGFKLNNFSFSNFADFALLTQDAFRRAHGEVLLGFYPIIQTAIENARIPGDLKNFTISPDLEQATLNYMNSKYYDESISNPIIAALAPIKTPNPAEQCINTIQTTVKSVFVAEATGWETRKRLYKKRPHGDGMRTTWFVWHRLGGVVKPYTRDPGMFRASNRWGYRDAYPFNYWNAKGDQQRYRTPLRAWSPNPAIGAKQVAFAKLAARAGITNHKSFAYKYIVNLSLRTAKPSTFLINPRSKVTHFGIKNGARMRITLDPRFGFFSKYANGRLPRSDPFYGWARLLDKHGARRKGPRRWLLNPVNNMTYFDISYFKADANLHMFKNEYDYYRWLSRNVDKALPYSSKTSKKLLRKNLIQVRKSLHAVIRATNVMYLTNDPDAPLESRTRSRKRWFFQRKRVYPPGRLAWVVFIIKYTDYLKYKARFFTRLPFKLMPFFARDALYLFKFFIAYPAWIYAILLPRSRRYVLVNWVIEFCHQLKVITTELTPASLVRLFKTPEYANFLSGRIITAADEPAYDGGDIASGFRFLYDAYFFISWLEERIYCQKAWRLVAALRSHAYYTRAFRYQLKQFRTDVSAQTYRVRIKFKLRLIPDPVQVRAFLVAQLSKDYTRVRWYRKQVHKYSSPEYLRKYDLQTRRSLNSVMNHIQKKSKKFTAFDCEVRRVKLKSLDGSAKYFGKRGLQSVRDTTNFGKNSKINFIEKTAKQKLAEKKAGHGTLRRVIRKLYVVKPPKKKD